MQFRTARRLYRSFLVLLALILCAACLQAQTWTKQLADGVTLTQKVVASPAREVINVLTLDPKTAGVRIRSVLSQERVFPGAGRGCEAVSSMAKRLNATVAVNGDFFPIGSNVPGDPLNLMVRDGEIISEPSQRVVFGVTSDGRFLFDTLSFDGRIKLADGKWFPIRGINRGRGSQEMVAYTPEFCDHTCTKDTGSEAIVKLDNPPIRIGTPAVGTISEVRSGAGDSSTSDATMVLSGEGTGAQFINESLKPGMPVTIQFAVAGRKSEGWDKVVEAVGGGSWLVRGAREFIDAKDEGFGPTFYASVHPRTAIGLTKDRKLVVVTVDGRQNISGGMTLSDLATVMIGLGCVSAINLDGGGSTTMATSYGILNSPSGGIERLVSDGLAIFGQEATSADEPEFTIAPVVPVFSGTSAQIVLLTAATSQPLSQDALSRVIWSTRGGAGFVDQSGRFYGVKAHKGEIVAKLGSRVVNAPVETIAGPPQTLTVELKADPSGAPNRGVVNVSVSDLNANGVGSEPMTVKAIGGTADEGSLTTDDRGQASTGVTWDAAPGRVEVTCGRLSGKASAPSK